MTFEVPRKHFKTTISFSILIKRFCVVISCLIWFINKQIFFYLRKSTIKYPNFFKLILFIIKRQICRQNILSCQMASQNAQLVYYIMKSDIIYIWEATFSHCTKTFSFTSKENMLSYLCSNFSSMKK